MFSWQGYLDFQQRHQGHAISYLNRDALAERKLDRLASWDPRKVLRSAFGAAGALALRIAQRETWDLTGAAYDPNADVKQAFQGAQTLTTTNLQSLATSATAGWQSDGISNTTNLYLDTLFQFVIAAVNTAPANSRAFFLFASHSLDGGTTYTSPLTGSQGTLTYPDVTTSAQVAKLLGLLPYVTQNAVNNSPSYSMAATNGGVLPERFAVGLVNHSGLTTAASGNTVKSNGVYATVI